MEDGFQLCGNCKRSVASAHFTLHEAHCLRFLVLCPECEEPVPKEKFQEHQQNEHQQTKEQEEDPIKCKFCELSVRLSKLEIHETHCGSRRERCPHCEQLITLRVMAQHTDFCGSNQAGFGEGRRVPSERKIHCVSCNQMIPGNIYIHHMGKCCPVSESVKHHPLGKPKLSPPSLPSQADGTQTSTSEKDVRPKEKTTISSHPSKCSTKPTVRSKSRSMDLPLKSKPKLRAASPTEEQSAYDILRRCSECAILLPLPTLNKHQVKCQHLASLREKQVKNQLDLERKGISLPQDDQERKILDSD
ncbi:XIAP-associated factor 1 isoform X1 [Dipodomys spectabilis]|uniref:XIAP-associated factor 1 isoform X1 n=1 Tax=Dipodomys spectabilis TaxID=105255 RepID=UPI001C5496CB|nr:XIAP-associated factor 1 isoform X1 [Dipodomys spectabilis]